MHGKPQGVPHGGQVIAGRQLHGDRAPEGLVLSRGLNARGPIEEGHLSDGRVEVDWGPLSVPELLIRAEDVVVERARGAEGARGVGLIEAEVAVAILEADGQLPHLPVGRQPQFGQPGLGRQ